MESRSADQELLTTKLLLAIREGKEDEVIKLMQAGADLASVRDGKTPLEYALYCGNTSLVIAMGLELAKTKKAVGNNAYHLNEVMRSAVEQLSAHNAESIVSVLLEAGASPDQMTAMGPLLHWAIQIGSTALMKQLIQKGANLAVQHGDKSAIQFAASQRKWSLVTEFANIVGTTNATESYGFRWALLEAVMRDQVGVVETLLKAKTPINCAYTDTKNTPLHKAVQQNSSRMIKLLLANGADPTQVNAKGQTPIHLAVESKQWGNIEEFARGYHTDREDKAKFNEALLAAEQKGLESMVDLLLDAGTPATGSVEGKILVHRAIDAKNQAKLEKLIRNHADLAAQSNGATAMKHAVDKEDWVSVSTMAESGHTDQQDNCNFGYALEKVVKLNKFSLARKLIAAGALNQPKQSGVKYVIHHAMRYCDVSMVKLLAENGADMSAVNSEGRTPVQQAYWEGSSSLCNALLRARVCDESDTYRYGDTALKALEDGVKDAGMQEWLRAGAAKNNVKAGRLFLQAVFMDRVALAESVYQQNNHVIHEVRPSSKDTALHIAVRRRNANAVRKLLEMGVDDSKQNNQHITPVELAVELGADACAELLINHDKTSGHTPEALHYEQALLSAIKKSNYVLVKMLLEHGAPCNRCDAEHGNIALYWAVWHCERNPEIVTLLLEHGADPNVRNKQGKTTVDLARKWWHSVCEQRIKNFVAKHDVRDDVAELRRELKTIVDGLHNLSISGSDIPAAISKLDSLYSKLIAEDLRRLKAKLAELHEDDESDKAAVAPLILAAISNPIDKLNLLIAALNGAVLFKDERRDIDYVCREEDAAEAKDLENLKRLSAEVVAYTRRCVSYLTNLKAEVTERDWKVKDLFGREKDGIPRHIDQLRTMLSPFNDRLNSRQIIEIYAQVMQTFVSLPQNTRRTDSTKDFYNDHIKLQKDLCSFMATTNEAALPEPILPLSPSQSELLSLKVTPVFEGAPATYQNAYPILNTQDKQVVAEMMTGVSVPLAVPPPGYTYLPAAIPEGDLMGFSFSAPVPSAPAPEPLDLSIFDKQTTQQPVTPVVVPTTAAEQQQAEVEFTLPDVPVRPVARVSQLSLLKKSSEPVVQQEEQKKKISLDMM